MYVLPTILGQKCILTCIYPERTTGRSKYSILVQIVLLALFVTVSVKNIKATEMTIEFPKRASSDSVIEGYSIAYTTEGLEDFISKGNAVVSRPEKTLTKLEEGAKYNITVKPGTSVQYHLEAGHTVQQTLPIGMLVVDEVCHCILHYISTQYLLLYVFVCVRIHTYT